MSDGQVPCIQTLDLVQRAEVGDINLTSSDDDEFEIKLRKVRSALKTKLSSSLVLNTLK